MSNLKDKIIRKSKNVRCVCGVFGDIECIPCSLIDLTITEVRKIYQEELTQSFLKDLSELKEWIRDTLRKCRYCAKMRKNADVGIELHRGHFVCKNHTILTRLFRDKLSTLTEKYKE